MSYVEVKKGVVMDGKLISSCIYDDIIPITSIDNEPVTNVFKIVQDGKLGMLYIDYDDTSHSNKIIDLHEICYITKKYVIVSIYDERHGVKYGVLNMPYLAEMTPFTFDSFEVLDNNLIKVKKDGLYGIINGSGEYTLATVFKNIEYDKNTKTIKSELYVK